jgi:hypothetical protein
MAQDPDIPAREINTEDVVSVSPEKKKSFARRNWGKLTLFTLLVVPLGGLLAYSFSVRAITYSSGNRVGFVQKLSNKGWVCKTWEGELQISSIPGSAPVLFAFTVQNDSVARAIEAMLGKQVELSYREHPKLPLSCFGETNYKVTGVKQPGS